MISLTKIFKIFFDFFSKLSKFYFAIKKIKNVILIFFFNLQLKKMIDGILEGFFFNFHLISDGDLVRNCEAIGYRIDNNNCQQLPPKPTMEVELN